MSLAAYAIAVRNHLRENLTSFYDDDTLKEVNCRITPDERVTPECGQEFVSVMGSVWRPRAVDIILGVEEQYGLVIAVSRRIGEIPFDHRGETAYIQDSDKFVLSWLSLEARLREVIGLVDKNFALMAAANELLDTREPITEPLVWVGSDPLPIPKGADHFLAFHEASQGADEQYGLMMRARFDRGIRLQGNALFDTPVGS